RGRWRRRVTGSARGRSRSGARRARGPRLEAEELVERGREVLGLRVLRVVDEHAAPAVDVDVELGDEAFDRLDLVLLGVDDERVGPALGDDEGPPLLARAWLR